MAARMLSLMVPKIVHCHCAVWDGKCPHQVHVLDQLNPSWWYYAGNCEILGKWGLGGGP